jgi:hypothetical protein
MRELRGFAPIGMLEYWNIGMMGSKEKEQSKTIPSDCRPNIPLFQHSIIP